MSNTTEQTESRSGSPAVTVFGSSQPLPGSPAYEQAQELGRLLAEAGYTVVNGGYSGTMEGSSRGATLAGGRAVGVTCALFDGRRPQGNPYLSETVHAPDLLARLRRLTEASCAYIVLGGGVGTLLELFLVWNLRALRVLNAPCIVVGAHWRRVLADLERTTEIRPEHLKLLHVVDTPAEAVRILAP